MSGPQRDMSASFTEDAPTIARLIASAPRAPSFGFEPSLIERNWGHLGNDAAAATAPLLSKLVSPASKVTKAAPRPATSAANPSPNGFLAMPNSRSNGHMLRAVPR